MGGRRWTRSEELLLGTDIDSAVSKIIGRSKQAVVMRRIAIGIPPHRPQYARRVAIETSEATGSLSDSELSRQTGHTVKTIRTHRVKLNRPIGPAVFVGKTKDGRPVVWSEEHLAMLGKRSDTDIAREMGLTRQGVRAKRLKLGIDLQ